jgi:thiol-disulfide isomerase/thioredoxin
MKLTLGLLALTAIASAQRPPFQPVPVGTAAPNFSAFTPSGAKVSLSQFKGKVVILDFWASWCGPCQASMPGLEKIYSQIKDKGVVVLSLNTWDQKPDFQSWIKENSGTKYHFNFVRDPAEGDHDTIRKNSIAKRLYHVIGIPTMYIIDREGKVAGSLLGSGNEAELVKLLGSMNIKADTPKS